MWHYDFYNNLSEEEKKQYIDKFPSYIRDFKNPSPELVLYAAKLNPLVITEELFCSCEFPQDLLLSVLLGSPHLMKCGKQLTPEIVEKVVSEHPCFIGCVPTAFQTIELQKMAVKKDATAIFDIVPRSEELLEAMVKHKGSNIKYIGNPSERLKLLAIKEDYKSIIFIKKPSEELQLAALDENIRAIEILKAPCLAAQLKAVKNHGSWIKYIKKPAIETILEAIKTNPQAISRLKNLQILEILEQKGLDSKEIVNFFRLLDAKDYTLTPLLCEF